MYKMKEGKKDKKVHGRVKIIKKSNSEFTFFAIFPSSGDFSIDIYGQLKEEKLGKLRYMLNLKAKNFGNGSHKVI